MNSQLTFIVSTNSRNYAFTLPFVFFASKYNPCSTFDIYLYDDCCAQDISNGLCYIEQCFDCKINIKDNIAPHITPQLYRFLVEPLDITKYAYCADIDIMICENILPFHINKLENGKYCYDNEIRQYNDLSKMSGLHFCTQEWYKCTKDIRQKFLNQTITSNSGNTNCERILKRIAIESCINIHPLTSSEDEFWLKRPIHGQHISLSRRPFNPNCYMEDKLLPLYESSFIDVISNKQFKQLMALSQMNTREIFNTYFEYVGIEERF